MNLNSDGTPIRCTDHDKRVEHEVAGLLERKWNCEVRQFGNLCPIDFYCLRDGRLVGLVELKSRSHAHDAYGTVFLNVRKWLALGLGQVGLGCPALYVIQFLDGVRWIKWDDIDARQITIAGTSKHNSQTAIEPLIEIPTCKMTKL